MNAGSKGTTPVPLLLQQTDGGKKITYPSGASPKKASHQH
jgi:hypothetical protein